jgi:hypothetical protein
VTAPCGPRSVSPSSGSAPAWNAETVADIIDVVLTSRLCSEGELVTVWPFKHPDYRPSSSRAAISDSACAAFFTVAWST